MKIEQEYLYAAECQLATLEQQCERKSTSKSDLRRQREICQKMLQVCQEIDPLVVQPSQDARGLKQWGRVVDMLAAARTEPEGLSGALDRHIQTARGIF